jgi:hypothetical protein
VTHAIGQCQVIEETGGVLDRVGRKTRMQMFDDLEVASPTTKCEVAGADKEVAFVLGAQNRDFWMEDTDAGADGEWFDILILTNPARALFAQGHAHALDV